MVIIQGGSWFIKKLLSIVPLVTTCKIVGETICRRTLQKAIKLITLPLLHEQWRSQPKNWAGGKIFDFRRITLFCLEKCLSKHKMTICSKNWGGHSPFGPPRYAYVHE